MKRCCECDELVVIGEDVYCQRCGDKIDPLARSIPKWCPREHPSNECDRTYNIAIDQARHCANNVAINAWRYRALAKGEVKSLGKGVTPWTLRNNQEMLRDEVEQILRNLDVNDSYLRVYQGKLSDTPLSKKRKEKDEA